MVRPRTAVEGKHLDRFSFLVNMWLLLMFAGILLVILRYVEPTVGLVPVGGMTDSYESARRPRSAPAEAGHAACGNLYYDASSSRPD